MPGFMQGHVQLAGVAALVRPLSMQLLCLCLDASCSRVDEHQQHLLECMMHTTYTVKHGIFVLPTRCLWYRPLVLSMMPESLHAAAVYNRDDIHHSA